MLCDTTLPSIFVSLFYYIFETARWMVLQKEKETPQNLTKVPLNQKRRRKGKNQCNQINRLVPKKVCLNVISYIFGRPQHSL